MNDKGENDCLTELHSPQKNGDQEPSSHDFTKIDDLACGCILSLAASVGNRPSSSPILSKTASEQAFQQHQRTVYRVRALPSVCLDLQSVQLELADYLNNACHACGP